MKEKEYSLNDIIPFLPENYQLIGQSENFIFHDLLPVNEANHDSLVWINPGRKDKQQLLAETKSNNIICDASMNLSSELINSKCFIIVEDPKLTYLRITKGLNKSSVMSSGIHSSAIVDDSARIHESVSIGAFSIIGNCIIDSGTIIGSHCIIHDGSKIGKNVNIREHCSIGGSGFGYVKNELNQWELMPHIGNVIIEDDVDIFPYANIDRATLHTTLVKKGSKLDHYVHIGHNCTVGENSIVTAGVIFCGGSSVGNSSWIGANAVIKEKVKVGNNVVIGIGSVVTKDVSDGETRMGNPAKPKG